MPLIQQDRWAPSHRPYALDLNTATPDGHGGYHVRALWVGRKRGTTIVTTGRLHLFTTEQAKPATVLDAIATADMRYGGQWAHHWDGTRLLVNPNDYLTPEQVTEVSTHLDTHLRALPAVPLGYTGWYYRQDTT